MDKAIDIKRRAQRFIQTGDLDGALNEYQKLVATEDSDPYNFVLLADLLFKKNDAPGASERYLHAVSAYEKAGLYKNAIAVCKKMMRLSLSPPLVLKRLALLHALDGLTTESSLYYQQYADHLTREGRYAEAAESLRLAFDTCSDSIKVLEKLADAHELAGDATHAALAWAEAAHHYRKRGLEADASRSASRAEALEPGAAERFESEAARAPAEKTGGRSPFPGAGSESPGGDPDLIERNGSHLHAPPSGGGAARIDAADPGCERTELAPAPQGLRFDPEGQAGSPPGAALADVERLLREAESQFHAGDRDAACTTLLRAAEGYEASGKPESAAVIYRSLSRGSSAPEQVFTRWLANCERRGEARESAEVACALGERAIASGDLPAARAWFERARSHDPGNELAVRRLQRLGSPALDAAAGGADRGKVSLATGREDAAPPELDTLLADFQRAVETHVAGDAQSQYDLGMTYRDMGFVDQAIESFRRAGEDRAFTQRCAEMIGRCQLDQGRFDEAVRDFEAALALPIFSTETLASLRFQLGLAHEAAGRTREALGQFEQAYAAQPNLPEVGQKIRVLKRILEQG